MTLHHALMLLILLFPLLEACPSRNRQAVADGADPNREIGKCCTSAAECVTGHCTSAPLLNKLQLCSKPCVDNAGCPPLSGCQRIGDGSGGFRSVCLPCEIVANTNERHCPPAAGSFTCF
jgi:hypothetical protein